MSRNRDSKVRERCQHDVPSCWIAFFKETRRISIERRLRDARNGIRPPTSLVRRPRERVDNTGQEGNGQ